MDKEQEQFQLLGFLGIFKESIRIILSHPKILTKISLAFILPLTFITIANNELSKLISNKIFHKDVPSSRLFTSKWMFYWSFEALYFIFIFIIIFSLMSISAVVYTVACIYTGREVTFKEVMTAVPKVWKRLMFTLASNFCIVFAYTFVIVLSSLIIVRGIGSRPSDMTIAIIVIFTISVVLLSGGIIYLTITWQLANVISVMEECCGFQAMKKSRQLIKGNLGNAIGIFLVLGLCSVPIIALNQQLVRGNDIGVWLKILCAILIMVLNPLITLYGLVVNTVFYCVCKSYHQENIDKSNLVDHLEGFLGANVPLLKDVEIV